MHLFRSAAAIALVAGAISFPVAAQIPSTEIGGGVGVGRRGRFTISGTVREAEGQRPLDSIQVQLLPRSSGAAVSTFTNATGSFTFSDVPRGTYSLVVEAVGYETIREEIDLNTQPLMAVQLLLKREAPFGDKIGNGPTVSARELSIPRRAREAMQSGLSLLNDKSDYRGSVAQFQRAIREYPGYYEAYMQMGLAYMRLNDAAKSEQALRTSVDLSQRKFTDALVNLAWVYSGQKRYVDSEPLAREALTLDPDSFEAHLELARALHGLDRSAEAEAGALEAKRIRPDYPPTYLLLANIHLKLRNSAALIQDLDDYLRLAPNSPEADQARRMREQVLERMPNNPPRTP
jgi:carboxypeptidase family protein/tetratricopeptide repeat protein